MPDQHEEQRVFKSYLHVVRQGMLEKEHVMESREGEHEGIKLGTKATWLTFILTKLGDSLT